MKKLALFIGFFLLCSPAVTLAASPTCSAQGYTIVFVNGIWDTLDQAKNDEKELQKDLGSQYNNQQVTFQLGYNPSHLAGAGDLAQSAAQILSTSISDFDLDTILLQIYPEVTTRKLMLVGHSQGAFYTNGMYGYLLAHGEPIDSVGVYNVASPASFTAGGGKYLNSSGDTLLNYLRVADKNILPNNIDLYPTQGGTLSGHGFVEDYLGGAADRITTEVDGELSVLKPTEATQKGDCFTPPPQNFGYKTEAVAFAVADPTATVLKVGTVAIADAGLVAVKAAYTFALGAVQLLADAVHLGVAPPSDAQKTQDTEKIINKLYGSSVENLSPEDKKELLGSAQGASVALAMLSKPTTKKGIVLGTSTVSDTAAANSTTTPLVPKSIFPSSFNGPVWTAGGESSDGGTAATAATIAAPEVAADTAPTADNSATNPADLPSSTTNPTTDDSQQPTDPAPVPADAPVTAMDNPSIVINEIEWAGDMFDGGREWIELKNRTAQDIDLSHYVLYATDGGSQYIPLEGTLPASTNRLPFFVVQRDPNAPLTADSAQVFPFEPLANSGEQLALARVDDSGTTTIDMTPALSSCNGWCAGSVASYANGQDGETLSMERVSANASGTDPANWASNDMYTQAPNMPPPNPWNANGLSLAATPLAENSAHLPANGFYCNPDKSLALAGQNYHPATGQCTVFDRTIPYPGPLSAGVFKGTLGTSMQVGTTLPYDYYGSKIGAIKVDFSDAQAGDQYFVAIWKPYFDGSLTGSGACDDPGDDTRLPSYFTTGHWLARDGYCGSFTIDRTDVPNTNYVLIPFTYQP